jgi:gluconate 5-dehydrogenase
LFGEVDRKFGKLDILFNNAGIATKSAKLHEMPLEDWNRVISVDLTGVFLCLQEGIKLMLRQRGGSIINMSSALGLGGIDPAILATSNYVAAKHGVIGLTKSAAVQYATDNIRVNAIVPGFIEGTGLKDVEERSAEQARISTERIMMFTPMKRAGRPEELKGLAVYLASAASSFTTGATFVVDGGWCAW